MPGMEGAEFLVAVTLCFGGVGGEKVAQQKVIPPKRTAKGDGLHVESGWRAFTEVEASRNACLAKCLVTQGTELTRQCRRSRKTVQAQHDVHYGFRVHAHNSRAANVLDTRRFDCESVAENSTLAGELRNPCRAVRLDCNWFVNVYHQKRNWKFHSYAPIAGAPETRRQIPPTSTRAPN